MNGDFAFDGTSIWIVLGLALILSDQVHTFNQYFLACLDFKYLATLALVSTGDDNDFLFAFNCFCHD